jgi:hypothetical protein
LLVLLHFATAAAAVAVATASMLRPVAVVALLLRSPERSREQLMSSTWRSSFGGAKGTKRRGLV